MQVLRLVPGELTDVELHGVALGPAQRSVRRHLRAPATRNRSVPVVLGFSSCSDQNVSETRLADVGAQQCADVLGASQSQGSSSQPAVQLSIAGFTLLLHQQVKLLLRLFNAQNHWGGEKNPSWIQQSNKILSVVLKSYRFSGTWRRFSVCWHWCPFVRPLSCTSRSHT